MNDDEKTPSESAADYEQVLAEYDKYLDMRKIALDQAKYVYENLDKWLLSLSGGGVALTTASAALGKNLDLAVSLRKSTFCFVLAIIFALLAKGVGYMYARWFLKKTDQIWRQETSSFSTAIDAQTSSRISKSAYAIMPLNFLCFGFFVAGLLFLVGLSLNEKEGYASRTNTTAAEASISAEAKSDTEADTSKP